MRKTLKKKAQPKWISPMLATLVDKPFSKKGWIFEKKFDGVRCLIFSNKGKISLYSRNKRLINKSYPEVVQNMQRYAHKNFIVDGEIVYGAGKLESFTKLQKRMHRLKPTTKMSLRYYVFDLLYFNGFNLRKLPIGKRKELLKKAFSFNRTFCFTSHQKQTGERFFVHCKKQGWEGVIAKKEDSLYRSGRGRDWLKFKSTDRQEFVIGGFTSAKGSRSGFGALLLGYYERGALKYAGKVGTGFDEENLKVIHARLSKISRTTNPFSSEIKEKNVTWVQPKILAECAFTQWTKDGKLRHPRFLALITDKKAKDVRSKRTK